MNIFKLIFALFLYKNKAKNAKVGRSERVRQSRTSEATEREPKASCGLRQQRTSERSSRVSLRVSRHTRLLIKISKVILNIHNFDGYEDAYQFYEKINTKN